MGSRALLCSPEYLQIPEEEQFTELHPVHSVIQTAVEVTDPLNYAKLWRETADSTGASANFLITALTARVSAQKTKAEQKRRELLKQQEAKLNELASHLPIWRLYGWEMTASLPVVVLSYPWLDDMHPDRNAEVLARLVPIIKNMLPCA